MTVRAQRAGDAWKCVVTVEHDGERTTHSVTVRPADMERWGGGAERGDVEDLVARSFEFLLEREPAGSILKTFDLAVIPRFFPEYDQLFGHRGDGAPR